MKVDVDVDGNKCFNSRRCGDRSVSGCNIKADENESPSSKSKVSLIGKKKFSPVAFQNSKMNCNSLLVILVVGCCAVAPALAANSVQEEKARDARQALQQASGQLSSNLITTLTSLGTASGLAGTNVSHAAAILVRSLVTDSFQLGGVVAYMPRLVFLDGPTQFVEVLRLIRSNQIRIPNDVDSAIDTLISFANQYRDSSIGENFNPVFTFLPNLFQGAGDFMVRLLDSLFAFIA